MADIATAIRKHLLTKAAITNLIATRIYPGVLPTDAVLPAMTMLIAQTDHERHLGGESGVGHSIIRLEAYNLDPLDSRKDSGIVEQTRLVLADPDLWHTTVQGVWIECIRLLNGPFELLSPPRDASQRYRFRTVCDYDVFYGETAAT